MGAYLSEPRTDKESTDEANEYLSCGASQMQGWRMSQEDAHICELNFDTNTSLFAVFDGHGGSEVALYCSQKLPKFLKNVDAYKKGEFEQALKDAFIGFDATLVNEDVIEELKKLIPDDKIDETDTDDDPDEDEENIHELYNEGNMPLNELLEKLKDPLAKVKAGESSGTSKPLSPFLRGRRNGSGSSSVAASGEGSSSSTSASRGATENGECTSASDAAKSITARKLDNTEEEAVSSSSATVDKKADTTKSVTNGPSGNGPSSTEGASRSEPNERNSCNSPDSSSNANKSTDEESKNQKESSSTSSLEEDSDDSDQEDEEEDGDEEDEDEADTEDEESDEDRGDYEEDDKFLNEMIEGPGSSSGCTAVVALLHENELYVANAGDSRCVVCRDGKAMEMSFDHKPEDPEELERIRKAGGRVSMDGRVNGGLNLSRAIGDHAYKAKEELKAEEQMISALPDVKRATLTPKDEFMVLACDGIWNSLSSDEVIDFVRTRIQKGEKKMSAICEELFTTCLAPNTCGDGTGCDNMTAVIIQFQPSLMERFPAKIIEENCIDVSSNSKKHRIPPTSNNDELTTTPTKRIKTDAE